MRPDILFPLFAPVTSLPGIGPRLGKLVERLCGPYVVDLLWHLPTGIIERRFAPSIAAAPLDAVVSMRLRIEAHMPGLSGRAPYRVRCADGTGTLFLVFFHAKADWIAKQLPIGQERLVSGRIESFKGQLQMPHPDYILPPGEAERLRSVEPNYPLTAGIPLKLLHRWIAAALERAPALPEWADRNLLQQRGWPAWREAVAAVHAPSGAADLELATPPRQRLAYDELLANQLAIALVRAHTRRLPGRALAGDGRLQRQVLDALPFRLTGSQRQAVAEIHGDMAARHRMLRLLQGDVGSGKTVVALLAMLNAVESGAQAALMAPTELLARQHHGTLSRLALPTGLEIGLLTGRERGRGREQILSRLADGTLACIVGTHALLQDDVAFNDLALAVVDEQHRFGVEQRVALAAKGRGVDILVMTATPIPRTLMMSAYGDLDASRLTEKPAGRQPIATRAMPLSRIDEVIRAVRRAIGEGARVYWVCPLVEESEALDVAAAEDRHRQLADLFGSKAALIHGRMKGPDRDQVMRAFIGGDVQLLVSTTVIEVGVDVPEATIMVIEHAERFGLAQLHQLRGRVGRGDRPSACLLLYAHPLTATARARISVLRETEDGFRIAEEDLKLRGAGEVLGTRQSGLPEFKVADLAAHGALMPIARDDARLALERDPELATPRGRALRTLLYLFERDAAVRYLRSG